MATKGPSILILNGSPQGKKGNCAVLAKKIVSLLPSSSSAKILTLASAKESASAKQQLKKADAVIFLTGTYWDSWGSPLQKFLEDITDLEATPALLGKPCAVFVLMHSVGGKGVLSRLQGVLSTMGLLIPPMSGMVYSLAADLAMKAGSHDQEADFWQLSDISRILKNLLIGTQIKVSWTTWPVDDEDPRVLWLRTP